MTVKPNCQPLFCMFFRQMRSTDYLVRGMVGSRLKPVDLKLVDIALDRLFEKLGVPHSGEDLFARNIARGIDNDHFHKCISYVVVMVILVFVWWECRSTFFGAC